MYQLHVRRQRNRRGANVAAGVQRRRRQCTAAIGQPELHVTEIGLRGHDFGRAPPYAESE